MPDTKECILPPCMYINCRNKQNGPVLLQIITGKVLLIGREIKRASGVLVMFHFLNWVVVIPPWSLFNNLSSVTLLFEDFSICIVPEKFTIKICSLIKQTSLEHIRYQNNCTSSGFGSGEQYKKSLRCSITCIKIWLFTSHHSRYWKKKIISSLKSFHFLGRRHTIAIKILMIIVHVMMEKYTVLYNIYQETSPQLVNQGQIS